MKTRSMLLTYGLMGVAFALAVGAVGLWGQGRIGHQLRDAVMATQAVRDAAMADMMHDAIRGNVMQALLGAAKQEPSEIATAQADLNENAQKIVSYLNDAKRLNISAEVNQSIDNVLPVIHAYVSLAQTIVQNPAQGQAQRAAFNQKFEVLEKALDSNSQLITAFAERAEKEGDAVYAQSQRVSFVCLVLSVASMLLAAWRVSAGMMRSLGGEPGMAQHLIARVARGELSMAVPVPSGDNRSLMSSLSKMVLQLRQTVSGVTENASFVASASAQVSSATNDLSNRTQAQANSIERATLALRELADTVHQNANSASRANDLAHNAADVATKGGTVFNQVVEQMRGINEASKTIFDIIGVIDGIAFQTNILALNAAVEAARAGEQGRGFAVVAGEVRTLARRSAEAAKEIKSLISASVDRAEQGSALVDDAGTTMKEIVSSIQQVSHIISEISVASTAQTQGIAQVRSAMSTLEQGTQENSALVEESAAAAESLRDQAHRLADAMHVFHLPSPSPLSTRSL